MKKIIAILSLAVMLAALLLPTAFAVNSDGTRTAWVKTSRVGGTLNVRETPSKNAKVLAKLTDGTEIHIYPANGSKDGWSANGWCLIETANGKTLDGTGYVMANFVTFTKPKNPGKDDKVEPTYKDVDNAVKALKVVEPYAAIIKTTRPTNYVHLRWIPNTAARFIDKYLAGEEITVLAESKSWAQVRINATGYVGFIVKSCVDPLN